MTDMKRAAFSSPSRGRGASVRPPRSGHNRFGRLYGNAFAVSAPCADEKTPGKPAKLAAQGVRAIAAGGAGIPEAHSFCSGKDQYTFNAGEGQTA